MTLLNNINTTSIDWTEFKSVFLSKYICEEAHLNSLIAMWDYHVRYKESIETLVLPKLNPIIKGPSGCGKTYITKLFFDALNVPYIVYPCASVTSSGFYGKNISDCLEDLVDRCNENVQEAQEGVIILDEIDKMISRTGDKINFGIETQNELLKLLDGENITINDSIKAQINQQTKTTINTKKILFVCVGAFTQEQIKINNLNFIEREKFSSNQSLETLYENYINLFQSNTQITEQFRHNNMINELCGRINFCLNMKFLPLAELKDVIFHPTSYNSILQQMESYLGYRITYTSEFEKYVLTNVITKDLGIRFAVNTFMQLILNNKHKITNNITLNYEDDNKVVTYY